MLLGYVFAGVFVTFQPKAWMTISLCVLWVVTMLLPFRMETARKDAPDGIIACTSPNGMYDGTGDVDLVANVVVC
jgi:hypothetical protein